MHCTLKLNNNIFQFFLQPIIEKKLLNHTILNTLLENIKTLYNISGELIKELKEDTENISGAFYKLAPFFKLYSVYAYDYEQLSTLLQVFKCVYFYIKQVNIYLIKIFILFYRLLKRRILLLKIS